MSALTDGNQNYKRYEDTPGVEASPQPASTPGSVDPGTGWTTQPYLNFNGDYERYSDTAGISTTQPPLNGSGYIRYSDTPGITTNPPLPYERN